MNGRVQLVLAVFVGLCVAFLPQRAMAQAAADAASAAPAKSDSGYKIGVVDRKNVMEKYKKAEAEYKKLQGEVDILQKDIDKLSERIQAAKDGFDEEKDSMTPEERVEREDAIQRDYTQYQIELKTKQDEIDRKELRLMKELFSDIDEAVAQIAAEQGYHLVFEGSPKSRSAVIYYSTTIDMSQKVIDRLNGESQPG